MLLSGLLCVLQLLSANLGPVGGQQAGVQVKLTPGCRVVCHQDRCINTCGLTSQTDGTNPVDGTGSSARTGPVLGMEQTGVSKYVEVREQRRPPSRIQQASHSGSSRALLPSKLGQNQFQAQTVRDQLYTEHFRFCFREVKDGQCASPLPGLRTQEMCCRGIGQAWGTSDCVLCPHSGQNSSCQFGFHLVNGTKCVDVNECLKPGLCENGVCVNTMGSFSCVCQPGFILDASHGLCISRNVISGEKGQCYRVLSPGPDSCSLPILRNITRQICCCSRVGKAWGPDCRHCPYFGSEAFKKTCPAGPGYQYSASTLQFSQRVGLQLGGRVSPGFSLSDPSHGSEAKVSGATTTQEAGSVDVTKQSNPSRTPIINANARPSLVFLGTQWTSRSTVEVKPSRTTEQQRPPDSRTQDPTKYQHARPENSKWNQTSHGRPSPGPQRPTQSIPPQRRPGPGTDSLRRPTPSVAPPKRLAPSINPQKRPAPGQDPQRRPAPTLPPQRRTVLGQDHQSRLRQGTDSQRRPTPSVGPQKRPATGQDPQRRPAPTLPPQRRTVLGQDHQSRLRQGTDSQRRPTPSVGPQKRPASGQDSQRRPAPTLPPQRRTVLGQDHQSRLGQSIDSQRRPTPSVGPQKRPASGQDPQRRPAPTLPPQRRTVLGQDHQSRLGQGMDSQRRPTPSPVPQRRPASSQDPQKKPVQDPFPQNRLVLGQDPPRKTAPGLPEPHRSLSPSEAPKLPPRVHLGSVCEYRPGVCGRGHCVEQPHGRHTCMCDEGYELDLLMTFCNDRDECLQSPCGEAHCTNTPGSFRCVCRHGYRFNNTICTDIDECLDPLRCPGQECLNTPGSYRCISCQKGFHLLDRVCIDVDECSQAFQCPGQVCVNTQGSYDCVSCDPGYTLTNKQCTDLNECEVVGSCPGQECVNMEGSYRCVDCRHGYQAINGVCTAIIPPRAPSPTLGSDVLPLPSPWPGEMRECYYNLAERGTCNLLATNTTQQECCCTVGEGWGLGCQYQTCPPVYSNQFQVLCPSGRGYVTGSLGSFSYTDVDECKRFHPEVCKNGVCVNNIPGYSCYCPSGYVYDGTLLECVDHDECEEDSCVGGTCVNTVGSYYCSCPTPLTLDDTQRTCVNTSHLSSDESVSLCWQHVTADLVCQSPLLGAQVSFSDCCCLYGRGWGMECALCPALDSEEYGALCSALLTLPRPESYPDVTRPGPYGARRGGRLSGRTRGTYRSEGSPVFPRSDFSSYSEGDFAAAPPRPPSFYLPPRTDQSFGALPPPPGSRPETRPLITEDYEDIQSPVYDPRPGTRRVFDRPYEESADDDCGILFGCENGRCIRVAEGYTCDCYHGYLLDLTYMTCIDINECEDITSVDFPCINSRCVNTEGSFRCVCRRGYVTSHRPNHCVAA